MTADPSVEPSGGRWGDGVTVGGGRRRKGQTRTRGMNKESEKVSQWTKEVGSGVSDAVCDSPARELPQDGPLQVGLRGWPAAGMETTKGGTVFPQRQKSSFQSQG